jgi:hypothetical protein
MTISFEPLPTSKHGAVGLSKRLSKRLSKLPLLTSPLNRSNHFSGDSGTYTLVSASGHIQKKPGRALQQASTRVKFFAMAACNP